MWPRKKHAACLHLGVRTRHFVKFCKQPRFSLIHRPQTLTLKYPPHLSTADTDLSCTSCLLAGGPHKEGSSFLKSWCQIRDRQEGLCSGLFPRAVVTNCRKRRGLNDRISFPRLWKRRPPCLFVTCGGYSPQRVSHPSLVPLPRVANVNPATPGWVQQSGNFIHWSRNGEGRASALNTPSPRRAGSKGIVRGRRQARLQGSRQGAETARGCRGMRSPPDFFAHRTNCA